jgi:aldehyde:ferredoxin oxidoreductase
MVSLEIVVKSNMGGFHPCDLKAATYDFIPIGD